MTFKQLIMAAGDGVEIASIIGVSAATACRRRHDPYTLTMGELIALVKSGRVKKEDILTVLDAETRRSYGRK